MLVGRKTVVAKLNDAAGIGLAVMSLSSRLYAVYAYLILSVTFEK